MASLDRRQTSNAHDTAHLPDYAEEWGAIDVVAMLPG